MFVGVHERQLDDKGRLAFPVPYRTLLGDRCYLVFGADRCVTVYATVDFERMAQQALEKVDRGEMNLNRQRALAQSATLVALDKQGRVTIDEKLRDYAELAPGSKVIVAGNLNHAELWSESQYDRIARSGRDELAGSTVGAQ